MAAFLVGLVQLLHHVRGHDRAQLTSTPGVAPFAPTSPARFASIPVAANSAIIPARVWSDALRGGERRTFITLAYAESSFISAGSVRGSVHDHPYSVGLNPVAPPR